MRQLYNAAQDGFRLLRMGRLAQESHVNLQRIHRHVAEQIQGGISASEVVHLHDESILPQVPDTGNALCGVVHDNRLRHLQMEFFRCQAILLDQLREGFIGIDKIKILR